MSIERAVPLALTLNEVATNSLKTPWSGYGRKNNVKLVAGVGYGEGRLTVSDNGRGLRRRTREDRIETDRGSKMLGRENLLFCTNSKTCVRRRP